ncbi:MAG: bacillithiol system redox-active protein YtxJ [Ignavibacteriaceae bacterium]
MTNIKELKTVEEWDQLKKESLSKTDLVIFKYSPYCSISAVAEENFDSWTSSLKEDSKINFRKVNVISERPVSQHIAKDLGIVHQSPQIIWLDKNLKVKWNASHYQITESALKEHTKE